MLLESLNQLLRIMRKLNDTPLKIQNYGNCRGFVNSTSL